MHPGSTLACAANLPLRRLAARAYAVVVGRVRALVRCSTLGALLGCGDDLEPQRPKGSLSADASLRRDATLDASLDASAASADECSAVCGDLDVQAMPLGACRYALASSYMPDAAMLDEYFRVAVNDEWLARHEWSSASSAGRVVITLACCLEDAGGPREVRFLETCTPDRCRAYDASWPSAAHGECVRASN